MLYQCTECQEIFDGSELQTVDVREDWGDVVCCVCPRCHEIDYEGRDMIVLIEE